MVIVEDINAKDIDTRTHEFPCMPVEDIVRPNLLEEEPHIPFHAFVDLSSP